MKTLIRLEELAMFLFSIFIFSSLPFVWWLFPLLFLAPDLSMIGYAVNNKLGAALYNFFHHKGVALLCMVIGYYFRNDWWILTGAILFGHSSFDRLLGYGLKLDEGFSFTHLGRIGKK
jgi:hypothetical protein